MALVRVEDIDTNLTLALPYRKPSRHDKCIKAPSPVQYPNIDYQNLIWLNNLDGIKNEKNPQTTEDAHNIFMNNYHRMFVMPEPKKGFPIHSADRGSSRKEASVLHSVRADDGINTDRSRLSSSSSAVRKEPSQSHNIADYTSQLHLKKTKVKADKIPRIEKIKIIRRIGKILSFERSPEENETLFQVLRTFKQIANEVDQSMLKEVTMVSQIEQWKDEDFTVFGNTGLHLILKGSVKTLSSQCMKGIKNREKGPEADTPDARGALKFSEILHVGDFFGTLVPLEGHEPNSRKLSVVTLEPNCEFLKISTSDFAKTVEQMKQRDLTTKVNLLQSNKGYKLWTRQPLLHVANIIGWKTYPENTMIVSEGYKSPFLAYIKSGLCHVLRQVEVMHTLKNGKKEKRTKQVVMGQLGKSESFGEVSVLDDEPITCSVITAEETELAIIQPERLSELDETTRQLLRQSSEPTYGNLTKEAIHDEYIKQELKREWNQFKQGVVIDTINYRGIQPGFGKWEK